VFASVRSPSLGGSDLFTARRSAIDAPWSTPMNLSVLNSSADDLSPALSGDGLEMYFASTRSGPGPSNLFVTRRAAITAPWGAPQLVPAPVNLSGVRTRDPSLTPDGLTLMFAAGTTGPADVFTVQRMSLTAPWQNRLPFAAANSPSDDFSPFAESNGIVFFASDRPGVGGADVYMTWRDAASAWAAPQLVTDVSTAGTDSHAVVGRTTGRCYVTRAAGTGAQIFELCPPRDPPGIAGRVGRLTHLPLVGTSGPRAPFVIKILAFDVSIVASPLAIGWYDWRRPPQPDDGFLLLSLSVPNPPIDFRLPGFTGGYDLGTALASKHYPVMPSPIPTALTIPNDPLLVGLDLYAQLALLYRTPLTGGFSQVLHMHFVP
jgi:hypothetical protein